MYVRTPDVPTQKVIGEILYNIDEKIATNNQLSKILEDIAQTIFKSWFIDFDPVKAKMAGEKPVGMDAATAALFPDSMEDSELGLIPTGWETAKLAQICSTTIGGLWGKDMETLESPEAYHCLRGVDMDDLKQNGFAARIPLRWEKRANYEKRLLGNQHILIAGSGAGPVGKSLLWDEAMNSLFDKPLVFSNFVKRFECKTQAEASYASSILARMYNSGEMFIYVNGTSVPNLQDGELLNGKTILIPPSELLKKFDDFVRTALRLKYCGENVSLVEIRDSLLPRLISGELQIPEEMLVS
jgi:type I restriction enzyme S subunit